MPNTATPFFNPSATTDYFKRIVLLLDDCPEETKSVIRSIYPQAKHDEISAGDATELLERSRIRGRDGSGRAGAATGTSTTAAHRSASTGGLAAAAAAGAGSQAAALHATARRDSAEHDTIRQILIYPQGKGGISINTEDYMCLAIDQYLNDVIIDFYLKYLLIERLSAEQRDRTHVFSTFFYKRLTTLTTTKRGGEQAKMTASQKRHFRVKNWTKGVNLFEKDYIIIPINEQSHWFLAIVCFPALQGPRTIQGDQPVVVPAKRPPKRARDRKRNIAMQIGSTTITPVSKDMVFVEEDDERDEAEGDESDLAGEDSDGETTSTTSAAAAAAAAATAAAASPPDPNKAVPVKQ